MFILPVYLRCVSSYINLIMTVTYYIRAHRCTKDFFKQIFDIFWAYLRSSQGKDQYYTLMSVG